MAWHRLGLIYADTGRFKEMINCFEEKYNNDEIFLAYKYLLDSDMFYNEYLIYFVGHNYTNIIFACQLITK